MKSWKEIESEAQNVQNGFKQELVVLHSQGIIKETDFQKLDNQLSVSRNALLETLRRKDIGAEIRDELFVALMKDYFSSVQRIIDESILRLGTAVFVSYKFNQVDQKALNYVKKSGFSVMRMKLLESFMAGARGYALRILPDISMLSGQKVNFQKLVNDYAALLEEYVQILQNKSYDDPSALLKGNIRCGTHNSLDFGIKPSFSVEISGSLSGGVEVSAGLIASLIQAIAEISSEPVKKLVIHLIQFQAEIQVVHDKIQRQVRVIQFRNIAEVYNKALRDADGIWYHDDEMRKEYIEILRQDYTRQLKILLHSD